jgi:hypothetical protein
MKTPVTNRDEAKARARELRAGPGAGGAPISDAEALERVAAELGYPYWNTASARLSNEPGAPLHVGDLVVGQYLEQPFTGRAPGVGEVADGAAFDVTISFDAPVDAVEFECFPNLRTQLQIAASAAGVSAFRKSDGAPHMVAEPTGGATL